MRDDGGQAIFFYSRHPITAESSYRSFARAAAIWTVRPEVSIRTIRVTMEDWTRRRSGGSHGSRRGHAGSGFCAGFGVPALFGEPFGAWSPALNLTPARVRGADVLTPFVGLQQQVQIVEGNVMAAPIPDKSVDVVVSQEALLHVADRRRAMAEAFRVLRTAASSPSPIGLRRRRSPGRRGPSVGRSGRPSAGKPEFLSGLVGGHRFSRSLLR